MTPSLEERFLLLCGNRGPVREKSEAHWICNRTTDHPGPHRHYDPRTFRIEAEWKRGVTFVPIREDPEEQP